MYEIIGHSFIDIPPDASHPRAVRGHSVWFSVAESRPGFSGRSASKVFFSSDRFPDFQPRVGDRYMIVFNQSGRLQGYQSLDA